MSVHRQLDVKLVEPQTSAAADRDSRRMKAIPAILDGESAPISDNIKSIIRECDFFMLRWETEFTPDTGITAVTKQECKFFHRWGVMISPWCPGMARAKVALEKGEVVDTGSFFTVEYARFHDVVVRILVASRPAAGADPLSGRRRLLSRARYAL